MGRDRDDDGVLIGLRLFERGELARKQRRWHEMAVTRGNPARDQVLAPFEIDETHVRALIDENVAIGTLERGAGDDTMIAGFARRVDPGGNGLEPGPAVLVGERDAAVHLLDV